MTAPNNYVEIQNGGYYVAGTRIGLDVLVNGFRNGESAEDLFASFPALGSLAKVYGAITFILENPREIDEYLHEQARLLLEIQQLYPMPQDMLVRFEHAQREAPLKIA